MASDRRHTALLFLIVCVHRGAHGAVDLRARAPHRVLVRSVARERSHGAVKLRTHSPHRVVVRSAARERSAIRCSDGSDLSTYAGTSTAVKAVVGSLTAVVNALFPPKRLSAEEEAAKAARQLARDRAPPLKMCALMAGLREDFAQQYLFTGLIDPNLYDDDCVFTDPTLSFTGLATFERNLASLRPVLDAVLGETAVDLYSLEASRASDSVVASWRMSGAINLPWRPRIELRGRTRYTLDPLRKGRIVRYDESWESSAAEQLLALFKPGAEPDDQAGAI